jgi:hypothetical protein
MSQRPANVTKADGNYLQNLAVKISKMPTKLFGSSLMITNILEWRYTCLKNLGKWLSARLTIFNLAVTMPPQKHIFASHPHTTGLELIPIFYDT